MKLTSKSVSAYYRSLVFWADKLENGAACWRARERAGIEWNDEERKTLVEAYGLFQDARAKVDALFSKRIGELVTKEIRMGEL